MFINGVFVWFVVEGFGGLVGLVGLVGLFVLLFWLIFDTNLL